MKIDVRELKQRVKNVQEKVSASGFDALLVTSDANITYLSGVYSALGERTGVLLVPAAGAPTLIVPRLDLELFQASQSLNQVVAYWEKDAKSGRNWFDQIDQHLTESSRIGIDPSASIQMTKHLDHYQWQVCDIVEQHRLIKSAAEVEITRSAASYWTAAMNRMLAIAKTDLPVGEFMAVGGAIADNIFANESEANWINTRIIQFFQCSPQSSSPHHVSFRPDERLPDGPSILNAIGAVCGYHAENERTILTGRFSAEHAELFSTTQRAHSLALTMCQPGVPCAEIDCAVQDYFAQQGMSEFIRHRVGHGFGLLDQEGPYLSEGSQDILQSGMLLSIEPGLYVEGVGGFRHSDTVLITDDGYECLTRDTPIEIENLRFG